MVSPRVTTRGPGDPEVAIVGGVHGDEPSGVRAVEHLLDADLDLRRGVKFVVANPPAVEAGERGIDADLNRTFPGDSDADEREARLAAKLCAEIGDLPTLSLHATHSHPEPIALVDEAQPTAWRLAATLPVPYVVDEGEVVEGNFTACGQVVTVESGCQHSEEATETAIEQARAFLRTTGALTGESRGDPTFYRMTEAVEKPGSETYELLVENFEAVTAGTTYARAGDAELTASAPFVPIMMSECGYDGIFGYKGAKLGEDLETARGA